MTSSARDGRTALQGFLPTVPAGVESGERLVDSGERTQFEVLAAGTLVAGKYRVCGELGRGGFAVVYEAEHLDMRRNVAIKVLHKSEGTPAVLIERFAREVRISALVRHPHVLEVFDAGALADGSPFLVMEKIQGETLHHHLCEHRKLAIRDAFELSRQLLTALVALAERGIVHRDIKPENMMLTRDELGGLQLKLLDFGIALLRSERAEALRASFEPRLTMQGALIGTPHYMAPEQLRSELVDARVDIYATGVVMYQALTGCMPYDGADLSSLTLNVLHGNARSLRELRRDCPPRLARIIDRALERVPERRYPSAASMLSALEACMEEYESASKLELYIAPLREPLASRGKRLGLGVVALGAWLLWGQAAPEPSSVGSSSTERAVELAQGSVGSDLTLTQLAPAAEVQPLPTAAALRSDPQQPKAGHDGPSKQPRGSAPDANPAELATPATNLQPIPATTPLPAASDAAPARTVDAAKAAALSRKALALYLHGDLAEAYSTYRRAVRENPDEPSALRGMGLVASRLGKTRDARRAFGRYLEVAPRAPDAALVKARLATLDRPAQP